MLFFKHMSKKQKELLDKLSSVLITALIGAGIAFLQSLTAQIGGNECVSADPAIAGTASGAIRTAWLYISQKYHIM
jgi:hypothetical protein